MKSVTILIPCYNEEKSLPFLHDALQKLMEENSHYQWQILFVDDGSKDKTLEVQKELAAGDSRYAYVSLSRNFGKENAMLAGFDFAQGDCVIILDADMQDPPELIPEMLKWWEEGYDDVYAKRQTRGSESFIRRWLSLSYYNILQRFSRFDILKNVGDFRLLDRKCIEALKEIRENQRYTKGMFSWIGFNKKEVVFSRGDRVAGKSAWDIRKLFNLGIEGITSFTTAPLRISTIIGVVVSIVSFFLMFIYLFKAIFFGDPVQGFPTLITVILFLGGIQLLSLGIIGEYLSRIFIETKHRPVYIVKETNLENKE